MGSALPASFAGNRKGADNDAAIQNAETRLKLAHLSNSALPASYGQTGHQSLGDQALAHLSPLMDLADTGLNIFERPGQAILHALHAFNTAGSESGGLPALAKASTWENAAKGFGHGLADVTGKDNLNLRGTLNQDPNAGGRVAGLFDTIGSAALDPTTYLTLGTAPVAKVGLKIIEEKLGKEVADAVAKQGIKSVGQPTQDAIRGALVDSTQAGAVKGGAEKYADRAMSALDGGKGVKWAGKTALKYDTLAPAANAAHLPQVLDAVKASAPVDLLRRGFVPMARVADTVGPKAAEAVDTVLRRGRAATNNATSDVLTQMRSAVKDSGLSLDEIKAAEGAFNGDRDAAAALSPEAQQLVAKLHAIDEGGKAATERARAEDISTVERTVTRRGDATRSVPGQTIRVGEGTQLPLDFGEKATVNGREVSNPNLTATFDKAFPGAGRRGADAVRIAGHQADVGAEHQLPLDLGKDVHVPGREYTVKGAGPEFDKTFAAFSGKAGDQGELFTSDRLGRQVTKDAVKAIGKNPTEIAKKLGLGDSATPGNIINELERPRPNESLQAANERLSALTGIKNPIETNPVKVITDQTVKAHKEAVTSETLHALMDIKDDSGRAIISSTHRDGDVARKTVNGTVYGPKEVLDAMDRAEVTLNDDHAVKAFGEMLDKWGKLWRGYATVPVLFGAGFHERNFVGNVWNMWLSGFKNPALFKTSDTILRAIESGTNKGLTAEAAIDGAKNLSPQEREWTKLARKEGITTDSFFRTDQATTPIAGKSARRQVGDAVNPVSPDNLAIRPGTYVGRRIEDNSRLAMFFDQMQKHGDPALAAENVKKALFDYSELTPLEKKIKKVVPFYTFMRKNTPFQFQSMLENPGKFSTLAHFRDNAMAGASDTNGKPMPQYTLANGAIPLVGGKTPILGSFSLPYQNAAQIIQPLLQMASQAPGVPKGLKTEGGTGAALRQIISNFGGGPLDLAKFATEEATGTNLYTGQPIKPGSALDGLDRTAKALIPLYGKGKGTVADLASGDSGVRNARLLAALTGLSTTALTDNRVEGEKARRAKALQALAQGTSTIGELRKQGKAPKAARKSKAKGARGLPKTSKKAGGSLPKSSIPGAKKRS